MGAGGGRCGEGRSYASQFNALLPPSFLDVYRIHIYLGIMPDEECRYYDSHSPFAPRMRVLIVLEASFARAFTSSKLLPSDQTR
jgi:hypothetical protein